MALSPTTYSRHSSFSKAAFSILFPYAIPAGFPSPAEDYCQKPLDLNELLVHRREATIFVTIQDNSMSKYGIHAGDLLIVDRSLSPTHGKIVLLHYQGEEYVRRYYCKEGKCFLAAQERGQSPQVIELTPDKEIQIRGVVRAVIHSFRS